MHSAVNCHNKNQRARHCCQRCRRAQLPVVMNIPYTTESFGCDAVVKL